MQKINNDKSIKKILKPVTVFLIIAEALYFLGFYLWSFDLLFRYEDICQFVYMTINPFTIGSYILGVTVLLSYLFFRNKIIKVILSVFYILIIMCTLVAIMGMSQLSDLIIYIPHVLIIISSIIIVAYKYKRNKNYILVDEIIE